MAKVLFPRFRRETTGWSMSRIRIRPLRHRTRKRNPARIRVFHNVESDKRYKQLAELTAMLFGSVVLAHGRSDELFRARLRKLLFATITDPEDLALFPDFLAPANRRLQ